MTLAQLREEKNTLSTRIQELAKLSNTEENGELRGHNTEEKAEWDKINKRYDEVHAQVAAAEAVESRAAEVAKQQAERNPETRHIGYDDFDAHRGDEESNFSKRNKQIKPEDFAIALQGWARRQHGRRLHPEHEAACKRANIFPEEHWLEVPLLSASQHRHLRRSMERRALEAGDAAEGGYTIPVGFVAQLERAMLHYGPMLQEGRVIQTSQGNALHWPKVTDTSNTGVLVDEEATVETFADPVFSEMVLDAFKYSSKGVKITPELLEDSAFDLEAELADMLGERLGRILNSEFTTGDGSGNPNGIVTATTTGVTAASATAIKADEFIDLIHSVDIAYRDKCKFMMHDTVFAYARKLKTSDGQYLWVPGMTAGAPDRLYGYPVRINNHMASSIVASAKTVLFADFNKYIIRRVGSLRMRKLTELYAATDQIAFIAFVRYDADLLQAAASRLLVQAT